MRATLAAMHAAGLRRLVLTSALGVGESYAVAPFVARVFFRTLLRGIYADKAIGDQAAADPRTIRKKVLISH